MKPIVVVPTYNEIQNLERITGLILDQPGGFHILVVDDNSPDGTGRLADELSSRRPGEIFVLHRARKEALDAIGLDRLFSNGYLFQIETTYRLHRTPKFSIGELSIVFRDRDLGRSKIDLPIILEAVWGVIRLRLTGR